MTKFSESGEENVLAPMLTIKILGMGCPNCCRLETETRAALDMMGPPRYELIKVTNVFEIAEYGVLSVPGLVINEQVLCSGRVPHREQIITWIQNATRPIAEYVEEGSER